MALEDILERIGRDAAAEAERLLGEARDEAEVVLGQAHERAESTRAAIVEQARTEAESDGRTRIANARLRARDRLLAMRGEMVDEVMRRAQESVVSLSDDDYAAFLARGIVDGARGGETVLVAPSDKDRLNGLEERIRTSAAERGVTLALEFSNEPAPIENGVLLKAARASVEVSAAAAMEAHRAELEMSVAATLFERDEG